MDKLISACYTPALADKSVYASGTVPVWSNHLHVTSRLIPCTDTTIPAYSAAHRGEFYGTSTNAGKKVFTVVAANPATQLISVSCSLGADSPTTDYIKVKQKKHSPRLPPHVLSVPQLTSAKASENAESKVIKKLARVTPVKFTYGVLIEVDYSTSFRCTWQSVAAWNSWTLNPDIT